MPVEIEIKLKVDDLAAIPGSISYTFALLLSETPAREHVRAFGQFQTAFRKSSLHFARGKRVGLLAYVYPVLPFSQNVEWLVPSRSNPSRQSATLANRALQDWLVWTQKNEDWNFPHSELKNPRLAWFHVLVRPEYRQRTRKLRCAS